MFCSNFSLARCLKCLSLFSRLYFPLNSNIWYQWPSVSLLKCFPLLAFAYRSFLYPLPNSGPSFLFSFSRAPSFLLLINNEISQIYMFKSHLSIHLTYWYVYSPGIQLTYLSLFNSNLYLQSWTLTLVLIHLFL